MSKLKIINQEELKDWAKEIFQKNSFNMVDVSSKKETFRRALASGKIYVGKEVFDLIKNKKKTGTAEPTAPAAANPQLTRYCPKTIPVNPIGNVCKSLLSRSVIANKYSVQETMNANMAIAMIPGAA